MVCHVKNQGKKAKDVYHMSEKMSMVKCHGIAIIKCGKKCHGTLCQ